MTLTNEAKEKLAQEIQDRRRQVRAQLWEQQLNGTYPPDVEMRAMLRREIEQIPTCKDHMTSIGMLFEDYITSYPVNTAGFAPADDPRTTALGAYGGVLNFDLLDRALDEILEVGFDKFGFMLEWIQQFEYLSPTFSMIAWRMRRKMPEYDGLTP